MEGESPLHHARLLNHCLCLLAGGFPQVIHYSSIDAIFVWGRARGEWEEGDLNQGILATAAALHRRTHAPIVIPGYCGQHCGQGDSGYPGPEIWKEALTGTCGVEDRHIIALDGRGHNTKTEADDFLAEALKREWKTMVGVTQHFHALRAMLGVVRSLHTLDAQHLVFVPTWPTRFDLRERLYGSQGKGPSHRHEWFDGEFDRIARYQAQGDLASFEELKAYLRCVLDQLPLP